MVLDDGVVCVVGEQGGSQGGLKDVVALRWPLVGNRGGYRRGEASVETTCQGGVLGVPSH